MKSKFKLIIGIIVILILILLGFALKPKKKQTLPCYKKTIVIWAPFEKNNFLFLEKLIRPYCLKLRVYEKSLQEIKNDLLPELASKEPPTIVYVDTDFLLEHKEAFEPFKEIKKEGLPQISFNINEYPSAINKIFGNQFLAYPITYDTLVLFWNKYLLNSAGYVEPPNSFEGIIELIPSLRRMSQENHIILSPIALGSAENIDRYFEIFLVLWKMLNPEIYKYSVKNSLYKTLDFYTQFTNPNSSAYSWHQNMPNAVDAFLQEKTAMIIDFYSKKREILKRNPRFNLEISPIPKISANPKKTNYIEPYFFAVTKGNSEIGWVFLKILDKNYEEFVKKNEIQPIKITLGKDLQGESKMLFEELLVGDNFENLNKKYLKDAIKLDIENWLVNRKDVEKIISIQQASRFFKK